MPYPGVDGFFDAERRGLEQDGAPQCAKNAEIRHFLVRGKVPSLRPCNPPQKGSSCKAAQDLLCYPWKFLKDEDFAMNENEQLQLFEDQAIRTAWDEENEEWYFSVVDVVSVLTDAKDYDTARNYWKVTKKRLKDEGSQLVTDCNQLKMKSPKDGKRYKTDVANTQQLFRIIQSIPSPKAEPMKLWLAQVGRERIEETLDPERIAERLVSTYERKGYTREWINQRLQAISARKELTDEWKDRGIEKNSDYAILTDEITRAWSGMSTRQYKNLKGLKKESLRDNMSTLELVLNMLAEVSAKEISQTEQPEGLQQNRDVARRGGSIAGEARKQIEQQTGRPAITSKGAAELNHVVTEMIEISTKTISEQNTDNVDKNRKNLV